MGLEHFVHHLYHLLFVEAFVAIAIVATSVSVIATIFEPAFTFVNLVTGFAWGFA